MLTPRFFDKPTAWSPTKAEPNHYISLAFNAGSSSPWGNVGHTTFAHNQEYPHNLNSDKNKTSSDPPTTVSFVENDWDDDVSLLNDDPDEDDDQLLPPSTYDVLAPLLDEMYKDESELEDDDFLEWNEEDVADGARAA